MTKQSAPFRDPRLLVARFAAVVCVVASVNVGPAAADSGGSVNETIYVTQPVRSVSVATGSGGSAIDLCSESQPLTFPNAFCSGSDYVQVTNGPVAGEIDIQGDDAVPSDGMTDWQLCGGPGGPSCSGPGAGEKPEAPLGMSANYPGQDQYQEETETEGGDSPALTNSAQCDTAFYQMDCQAWAGQSIPEQIVMVGPTASTSPSETFTSYITWTAVP